MDTFPQWLYQRMGATTWRSDDLSPIARRGPERPEWEDLPEESRAYWIHEAAAIRRAADRDGFKKVAAFDDGFGNEPPADFILGAHRGCVVVDGGRL